MTDDQSAVPDNEALKRILEDQERSGKMLIRRDLELTRANERLRELDRLKTDFVSIATHQMRTPLAGIKWALGMLLNGDFGKIGVEQEIYIRKAYVSTEHLIELLRDMLFADQVGAGKFVGGGAHVDLVLAIEGLLRDIQPLIENKQITVSFVPPAEHLVVAMSPEYARAIFQNLLENAVKYTRKGGSIKISISARDGIVECTVSDTGIGIPASQQPHIFERFYRAENAKKEVTDGSGLGLFIVKQLVEQMRGTIRFESAEGKGTTFYVSIPMLQ